MRKLTERGMRLAHALREHDVEVIESYPGAAQDIMRIPRKKSSLDDLRYGLAAFGLRGKFVDGEASHDELDAITSAVVGYFFLTGDVEALGNPSEDYLIIPRPTLAALADTAHAAASNNALALAAP
jgi:predicted nuclease with RNAse H fold